MPALHRVPRKESELDTSELLKLDSAVRHLVSQDSFASAVAQLEEELARSSETFVWTTVDLQSLPVELPRDIKSGWIFHLRRDVPSGAHYHPNSVQHMALVAGRGIADIAGERRPMVPFSSAATPEDRWLVIGEGVSHEFTPECGDVTVISFHTSTAEELEEVESGTGGLRHYEGADAS